MTESREMPKYQSHKKVWGLKIKAIEGQTITPTEEGYAPFGVSAEYIERHKPEAGGYYVVYEGGYKSFSPADAFEAGNTLEGSASEVEGIESAELAGLVEFYDATSVGDLIKQLARDVKILQERCKPLTDKINADIVRRDRTPREG